jgi:hypothetical protein
MGYERANLLLPIAIMQLIFAAGDPLFESAPAPLRP